MRLSLLLLVLCVPLVASGCFRYQTRVPGVVDLRSDGSEVPRAAPRPPPDGKLSRTDAFSLLEGEGVRVEGSGVSVEDRHVFARGLIPVWNTSAEEELAAALALGGGLAEVELGEEVGLLDIGISLVASCLPVIGFVGLSTYTFHASGDLLDLERSSTPAAPPSDPFEELPPPSLPAPPSLEELEEEEEER